jgi:hypothetical protein
VRRTFGVTLLFLSPALLLPQSGIRCIDLDGETHRQVVVDREPGQYLGHPTTVLLEDGRTVLVVYPKGHGRGPIVMKRSTDGGTSWSGRLPVPENWSTSLETPTIHRIVDPEGRRRLILFSGLYPARLASSEDDGAHWSPLREIGEWGGIVVMSALVALRDGRYLGMFHDDGRFFRADGRRSATMTLYTTFSADGGRTWSHPTGIFAADSIHLCEPGIVRSPDGRRLAALVRENTRRHNSYVLFSDDEGENWSTPRELPPAFTRRLDRVGRNVRRRRRGEGGGIPDPAQGQPRRVGLRVSRCRGAPRWDVPSHELRPLDDRGGTVHPQR